MNAGLRNVVRSTDREVLWYTEHVRERRVCGRSAPCGVVWSLYFSVLGPSMRGVDRVSVMVTELL
jgi:hypothetical protein